VVIIDYRVDVSTIRVRRMLRFIQEMFFGAQTALPHLRASVPFLYRVVQNDCRGFNNLSYTIHL